ncbi:MAG: autotransporter-associated beta strand repeat-containing protein [Chthoniobacter sp.]
MVNRDAGNLFSLQATGNVTIVTDPGVTATINAPLTGAGGITKSGAGTLVLTGTSTLGGNVAVNSGTLMITSGGSMSNANGSIASGSGLRVAPERRPRSPWTAQIRRGCSPRSHGRRLGYGHLEHPEWRYRERRRRALHTVTIGAGTGSSGTINVDGTGNPGGAFVNLNYWNMTIGDSGTGTLNIKNAARCKAVRATASLETIPERRAAPWSMAQARNGRWRLRYSLSGGTKPRAASRSPTADR